MPCLCVAMGKKKILSSIYLKSKVRGQVVGTSSVFVVQSLPSDGFRRASPNLSPPRLRPFHRTRLIARSTSLIRTIFLVVWVKANHPPSSPFPGHPWCPGTAAQRRRLGLRGSSCGVCRSFPGHPRRRRQPSITPPPSPYGQNRRIRRIKPPADVHPPTNVAAVRAPVTAAR